MLIKVFPFRIQTVQTDNGTEFTYKFISEETKCPFDKELCRLGIKHKLIPPRTPWHNGKVERSHQNDQRYFYDWETFRSVDDLNKKLAEHLQWSNNKPMRTLGNKSPLQLLREKLSAWPARRSWEGFEPEARKPTRAIPYPLLSFFDSLGHIYWHPANLTQIMRGELLHWSRKRGIISYDLVLCGENVKTGF